MLPDRAGRAELAVCVKFPRQMWRSLPTRACLSVLAALALGLAIAACGGGGSTVTVTETMATKPGNGGGSKKSISAELPPGPVTGYVDFAKVEPKVLILDGWAASGDLSRPASRVTAQVGGKTITEVVPAIKREDVVKALGKPGLAESGFELRLPIHSLECGSPAAGVKVIGSLGGKSSALSFAEGIKEEIAKAC